MQKQTDWLKILLVSGIMLGFLGACCDAFGLASTAFLTDRLAETSPGYKAVIERQRAMRPFVMAVSVVGVAHSLGLMVAPALVLRDLRRHAPLLRVVLLVGCVLVPLQIAFGLAMQDSEVQSKLSQTSGLGSFAGAAFWSGIVFAGVWGALKVGFFALTLRELKRALRESLKSPAAG